MPAASQRGYTLPLMRGNQHPSKRPPCTDRRYRLPDLLIDAVAHYPMRLEVIASSDLSTYRSQFAAVNSHRKKRSLGIAETNWHDEDGQVIENVGR